MKTIINKCIYAQPAKREKKMYLIIFGNKRSILYIKKNREMKGEICCWDNKY